MNSEYVKMERQKLYEKGYQSTVTSVVVNVDKTVVNMCLGNDIYILTGIKISKEDMADDVHTVAISSATNAIQYTQQQMAALGSSINNIFRGYMVIETIKGNMEKAEVTDTPRYSLEFIKITPHK